MESCDELFKDARALIDTGDYEAAIKVMESLLTTYPDFAQGHYDLGSLYFATGEKQQAFEQYQQAVTLESQNTTFLKSLADYHYSENNDVNEARAIYRRVIELDPRNLESLQILGNMAVVERDFETAKEYYQKVIDIEPWNHDALMIYEKLNQQGKKQTGTRPGDSTYEHSERLIQAGKMEEAIETLEGLIKEQPDYALAFNNLGVLYYQTGQKEKTLEYYQEAVRLEPNQLTFQKNLADFYCLELGQIENALEIYFRLLKEDPEDIETLMAVGYVSKALKRNDDAVVFFKRVLDIEPWNFEANENLNQLQPDQINFI